MAKMTQMTREMRARITVELENGVPTKDIAEEYGVSRSSVHRIYGTLQREKSRAAIVDLSRVNNPEKRLTQAIEDMKVIAPKSSIRQLDKIIDTAKSLEHLEAGYHEAFENILSTANEMLTKPDLSIIDWQIITNTLANAFKCIFNTSGTTINLNQSGQGESKLTMFQARMRN